LSAGGDEIAGEVRHPGHQRQRLGGVVVPSPKVAPDCRAPKLPLGLPEQFCLRPEVVRCEPFDRPTWVQPITTAARSPGPDSTVACDAIAVVDQGLGRSRSADQQVGLAAQADPGGCVKSCHAEGECGEAEAGTIDAKREADQRDSGEQEADELAEPVRPSVLQLGRCTDPRPDDTGKNLRPQRPLKAHERGERKHGDLGGEQAETQGSSNANDEQHHGEHAGRGPGAESQ